MKQKPDPLMDNYKICLCFSVVKKLHLYRTLPHSKYANGLPLNSLGSHTSHRLQTKCSIMCWGRLSNL